MKATRSDQRAADRKQVRLCQYAALGGHACQLPDVMGAAHADIRFYTEQLARLAGTQLAFTGFLQAGGWTECVHQVCRGTEGRESGQLVDHLGEFKRF